MTLQTMPDLDEILVHKQEQFDELKSKLSTLRKGILYPSTLDINEQIKYAILGSFYLWADINNKSKVYSGKEKPPEDWKLEKPRDYDDEDYLDLDPKGSE